MNLIVVSFCTVKFVFVFSTEELREVCVSLCPFSFPKFSGTLDHEQQVKLKQAKESEEESSEQGNPQ